MALNLNSFLYGSQVRDASSTVSQNIFQTGRHWILYFKKFLLLALVLFFVNLSVLFFPSPFIFEIARLFVIVGLLVTIFSLAVTFYEAQCISYIVSPSRIQIKYGIFEVSVSEYAFSNIESIKVFQSMPGRYFDYGDVTLVCNSGLTRTLTMVANPKVFLPKNMEITLMNQK